MPVTRERVDPIRETTSIGLVHRRWILPDDVRRAIPLAAVSRLWRGLLDLRVLSNSEECELRIFGKDDAELPAAASPGALLAGAGVAALVSQICWTSDEGRRDPYALDSGPDPEGYREYTLYSIDTPQKLLLPIPPRTRLCAKCSQKIPLELARFGDAALLDLGTPCPACGGAIDLGRDKGELASGAIFLLEELAARAALSIEMQRSPQSEELPDAQVAALLSEAFGGTDELADDATPPSE